MGKLLCIKCNEFTTIKFHLDDVETLECEDCGETFNCADVRKMLESAEKWRVVLAFVENAPHAE